MHLDALDREPVPYPLQAFRWYRFNPADVFEYPAPRAFGVLVLRNVDPVQGRSVNEIKPFERCANVLNLVVLYTRRQIGDRDHAPRWVLCQLGLAQVLRSKPSMDGDLTTVLCRPDSVFNPFFA